jgi:uncharacterized protein
MTIPAPADNERPRYTRFAFPEWTYIPGKTPRPTEEQLEIDAKLVPLTCDNWRDCPHYLWGVDLFNHGYYWEAHEAWEALWHAAGRRGPMADFLKGLIKLAAAKVKQLEGRPEGVKRHLGRSRELLEALEKKEWCGVNLLELIEQRVDKERIELRIET